MNLLASRVADIVFEEGARFSVGAADGGLERVEDALARLLAKKGHSPATVTVEEFRLFYHEGWRELLDEVCPLDTHQRVEDRFRQLVFT